MFMCMFITEIVTECVHVNATSETCPLSRISAFIGINKAKASDSSLPEIYKALKPF